jgi:hypothetical protein
MKMIICAARMDDPEYGALSELCALPAEHEYVHCHGAGSHNICLEGGKCRYGPNRCNCDSDECFDDHSRNVCNGLVPDFCHHGMCSGCCPS